MNCSNCGSPIRFGGPPCCDGGASKRARKKKAKDALEERLAAIEVRLDALEHDAPCSACGGAGVGCQYCGD